MQAQIASIPGPVTLCRAPNSVCWLPNAFQIGSDIRKRTFNFPELARNNSPPLSIDDLIVSTILSNPSFAPNSGFIYTGALTLLKSIFASAKSRRFSAHSLIMSRIASGVADGAPAARRRYDIVNKSGGIRWTMWSPRQNRSPSADLVATRQRHQTRDRLTSRYANRIRLRSRNTSRCRKLIPTPSCRASRKRARCFNQ
jgi:hypothetical protein